MATDNFSIQSIGALGQQSAITRTSAANEITARAAFQKLFAGEIMTTLEAEQVMLPLHRVKTITGGKGYAFPLLGQIVAHRHTPGTTLLGQDFIQHKERWIGIDGLTECDIAIASIDEAMMHYDVRQPYAAEMGRALARTIDKYCLQTAIRAARFDDFMAATNDPLTGSTYARHSGSAVTNAAMATDADVLRNSLISGAQAMDEKNAPESGRSCILKPAQYWMLIGDTDVMNVNWGGSGSLSKGLLGPVANIRLVKSNNIPTTNITTNGLAEAAAEPSGNDYRGDFTGTVGIILQEGAIGTVKLFDITVEQEYQLSRKATLLTAHYAMGHGVLRPEFACELGTTAATRIAYGSQPSTYMGSAGATN